MSVHETVQWQHEKRGKKLSSTLSDKCPPFVMLKERGKALHPNVSCRAPLFVSVASLLKGSHFKRNVGWERDITHWCCWIFELQGKKQKQKQKTHEDKVTPMCHFICKTASDEMKRKKKNSFGDGMKWRDTSFWTQLGEVQEAEL